MNQPILINTNNVQVSAKPAATTSSHADKTQAGQAFSSELDKHIEKPKVTSSKADPDVKKSDTDIEKDNVKNTKSEQSADKDGNSLPENNTVAEHTDQTSTKQNDNADVDVDVDVDDTSIAVLELDESTPSDSDDSDVNVTETNVEVLDDNAPQDVIPQGLIQTEALHAVVHDIKQTVVEQKQVSEEAQQKSTIGKLVSDTVKNMTKPNNPDAASAQSDLVEEVVQTKVATTQSTIEKETSPKLRPDILQALSLRAADNKELALGTGENAKTEAIIDKSVASLKSNNGQLQVPELLERIASKTATTQSNTGSDKSSMGVFFTSANQTALSGTANVKTDGPVLDIQPSLQSAAWNRVMTSRVLWMAREGVQQASLKLNPANLGPVEVRLNMHHDQANVTFIAQSAVTRDALEQAIPRLKESFAQNGLELTNADVSQQSFGQSGEQNQEEAGLNSGTTHHNLSQGNDNNSDQEQKIVDNESDIELGLSIYA